MICFASLDKETLPKEGLPFRERICSKRSKFFPSRVDSSFEKGRKMKMAELLPLKVQ